MTRNAKSYLSVGVQIVALHKKINNHVGDNWKGFDHQYKLEEDLQKLYKREQELIGKITEKEFDLYIAECSECTFDEFKGN